MTEKELMSIYGGLSWSTGINTIVKAFSFVYDLGRRLGSAIYRSRSGNLCR